ncbi:sensor histidine kinase [Aliikangiella maris]|uniref:ATP-binding protein n=2 Tax=Aliikangiella maris TaxID=3162458 RepID=A0ABV2BXZ0_9GAMM
MVFLITIYLFIGYINSGKTYYRPLPPHYKHELKKITKRVNLTLTKPAARFSLSQRKLQDIYLLDQAGIDKFGKAVPELLSKLHDIVKRKQRPLSAIERKNAYFGGITLSFENSDYWVYSYQKEPAFYRHLVLNFFSDIALSLFISTFIISFPVSFILSLLITKPIRTLQFATHQLQHDLTQRECLQKLIQRNDEFGDLALDFDNLATHLNKILATNKQLISDVSHELRSPLSRLKIALGIAEKSLPESARSSLQRIELEADRMNDMLEKILTLSKLESQQIENHSENFDLCLLIKSIVDDAQFEANQSNIQILAHLPHTCQFRGMRESIISGVENILRNAIKYAGSGSVIKINLTHQPSVIILEIEDNGPGVASDQLEKLFDAFYRPDFARSRSGGGIGLGLSIAKRAFEMNRGTIQAENIKPHGLKIRVTFSINQHS